MNQLVISGEKRIDTTDRVLDYIVLAYKVWNIRKNNFESHYFIDGTVLQSGRIPVLMVDTETDKYYQVTESGNWLILPYEEEE